jgi:O-antigen ligase
VRAARFAWEYVPPGIVLFILPIAHTTPLRFVCIGLSVVAVLATLARHGGVRAWPSEVLAALAFWFVVCALASLASIEPAYSWGEFRNEVLAPTAVFAVFFMLTDDAVAWQRFRAILYASFITAAIIAIASYGRDGEWLRENLVGDRNAFSTYVVLIVPFLILNWFLSHEHRGVLRASAVAALVLAAIAGALTQNRNMWFAIAAEVVVFAALFWHRSPPEERSQLRTRYLVTGAIGIVAFVGILAFAIEQKAAVSNTAIEEQARFDRDPRFEIWSYAAERIRERPWTGYGYGRGILRKDFREHFDNPLKWHGHNMVIDYFMEAGVAGAIAIVALFAALARRAWRTYRDGGPDGWIFGAWSLAMLVGIAIKVMTDDILVRESALFFWSALGMSFGLAARRTPLPGRDGAGLSPA